jgi:hypothetical protein
MLLVLPMIAKPVPAVHWPGFEFIRAKRPNTKLVGLFVDMLVERTFPHETLHELAEGTPKFESNGERAFAPDTPKATNRKITPEILVTVIVRLPLLEDTL